MRSPLTAGLALLVVLALSACARPTPTPEAGGGGIRIRDPYARTAIQGGMGGVYMTILNDGGEDRLLRVTFEGSEAVELHETVEQNGAMRMVAHPEGWVVPGRGGLVLKPGGKHIMLVDLKQALESGKDIELGLHFEKAGEITVRAAVRMP